MKISVHVQRSTITPRHYLLTQCSDLDTVDGTLKGVTGADVMQALAVVDDFGNLVIVRAWR